MPSIEEIKKMQEEYTRLRKELKAAGKLPKVSKEKAEKPQEWRERFDPIANALDALITEHAEKITYLFDFTKSKVPVDNGKHLGLVGITFNLEGDNSDYSIQIVSKPQKDLRKNILEEKEKEKA